MFHLRRGFALARGTKVLMVEDVVTTGLSSREAIAAVAREGGEVIAECAIIDRSYGSAQLGVPFYPLLAIDFPTYDEKDIPEALARVEVTKPGSRKRMNQTLHPRPLRLGVNIDHVATIRNARGGDHPDPVRAAEIVAKVGGDGITAHLREDRRHIRDEDLARIQQATNLPLNLEMAATREMLAIALRHKPHAACIVPEKREERTTEGGLDAAGLDNTLAPIVEELRGAGIRVSLFIEANERQLDAALRLGAPVVEFHTGEYAHAFLDGDRDKVEREVRRISDMAALAAKNGIEPHAGHGLTFENVQPIAAIPQIAELNIGHYLIGEAVFTGLENAIRRMRALMDEVR